MTYLLILIMLCIIYGDFKLTFNGSNIGNKKTDNLRRNQSK